MHPHRWLSPAPRELHAPPAMAQAVHRASVVPAQPLQHPHRHLQLRKSAASLPGSRACSALAHPQHQLLWPRQHLPHRHPKTAAVVMAAVMAGETAATAVADATVHGMHSATPTPRLPKAAAAAMNALQKARTAHHATASGLRANSSATEKAAARKVAM